MRIFIQPSLPFGDTDQIHEFGCARHSLLLRDVLMQAQRFAQLTLNRQHRIQAGHRLLENHGNRIASNGAHFFFRHFEQILTQKTNGASNFARRLGDQTQDRHRRHRLAATGLTNDCQSLALVHDKTHTINCSVHTIRGAKVCLKIFNF